MARSAARDPLTKFRWTMEIPGFSRLGFTSCQMPSLSIATKIYAEGGQHWAPKSIPDKFEMKPIVLSRGVTNDTSFNKWATGMIDLYSSNKSIQNASPTAAFGSLEAAGNFLLDSPSMRAVPSGIDGSNPSDLGKARYRKDIRIDHVNRAGQVEVSYFIYGAYPTSYTPGSDFDSMGDDSMSIESLTLSYDSFEVKYSGIAGFLGNIGADFLLG